MQLVETIGEFNIYEHQSGKGVIILKDYNGRKANGAIFDNPAKAQAIALATAFGGSVTLTHKFKNPVLEAK